MYNRSDITTVYKQNLESDIIQYISEKKGIDLREAMNIFYQSRLAEQIEKGTYGIENLDSKYLAEDLMENEARLFR